MLRWFKSYGPVYEHNEYEDTPSIKVTAFVGGSYWLTLQMQGLDGDWHTIPVVTEE